jgi:hypothetical protein
MVWDPSPDGFEYSYFNRPDGPVVYVKRKITATECVFVDFPESGDVETRVACGALWNASSGGYSLRCECADAGRTP